MQAEMIDEVLHVDGVPVINEVLAKSPLPPRNGKPVRFKSIKELHLQDGRKVFSNEDHTFVSEKIGVVRSHSSKRKTKTKVMDRIIELREDNRSLTAEVKKLRRSRDEWKVKAQDARRELADLKDVLGL